MWQARPGYENEMVLFVGHAYQPQGPEVRQREAGACTEAIVLD